MIVNNNEFILIFYRVDVSQYYTKYIIPIIYKLLEYNDQQLQYNTINKQH